MKIEFSPHGIGPLPPFPAIEMSPNNSIELVPAGRARIKKIDHFSELQGKLGALLDWPYFEKKGWRLIAAIGKEKNYTEGGDVQILRLIDPIRGDAYYTRPMEKGNELWGLKELSPVTSKLIKQLDRAISARNPE